MSGSSSSSVPRGVEVSSLHRPQAARRDKTVGSSSRSAAPPIREDQRMTVLVRRPVGQALSSRRGPRHVKPTLRGDRRKGRRPPAIFTMVRSAPTPTPCKGTGRGEDRRTWRRRRLCRRWKSLVLPAAPGVATHPRWRGPGRSRVLVASGGQGSSPAVVEAGGSVPERARCNDPPPRGRACLHLAAL
jgi:hypothetical protein